MLFAIKIIARLDRYSALLAFFQFILTTPAIRLELLSRFTDLVCLKLSHFHRFPPYLLDLLTKPMFREFDCCM